MFCMFLKPPSPHQILQGSVRRATHLKKRAVPFALVTPKSSPNLHPEPSLSL